MLLNSPVCEPIPLRLWENARRGACMDAGDFPAPQEAAWENAGPKVGRGTGVIAPSRGGLLEGYFYLSATKKK